MSELLQVSLIICTRNRAAMLERCLSHVARIEFANSWELVIVDNGSTDGTADVVRRFSESVAFPVIYTHEAVAGLSNARNAGVRVSKGRILIFTDDDCYVDSRFLQAGVAAFADPETGFVSGRIRLFDPDDYPATINESVTPLRFEPGRFIAAGALKGANMAFRRDVLDRIGPFDPLFGSGAYFPSEDADAVMRASLAGWAGRYVPEMIVFHHHGRKAADIASLHKSYDLGRGAYHAKLLLTSGAGRVALKAWATLPKRMFARPLLAYWELYGAIWYWCLRAKRA